MRQRERRRTFLPPQRRDADCSADSTARTGSSVATIVTTTPSSSARRCRAQPLAQLLLLLLLGRECVGNGVGATAALTVSAAAVPPAPRRRRAAAMSTRVAKRSVVQRGSGAPRGATTFRASQITRTCAAKIKIAIQ